MTDGEKGFLAGAGLGVFFAFVMTFGVSQWYWHTTLIRRGHAEYNQQTGAWQWKEQGQ